MKHIFRDIYSNRQINRWKRIVNIVGILKSKIKDLTKGLNKLIRQILLHWCYELTLS